jgi:hypothetical protein
MSAPTQKAKTPMSQQKKDYLKKFREKRKEFRTQASAEQLQAIKLLSNNIVDDTDFLRDLKAKIEKHPPKPDPTKPHPPPNRYPEAPVVREPEDQMFRKRKGIHGYFYKAARQQGMKFPRQKAGIGAGNIDVAVKIHPKGSHSSFPSGNPLYLI